MGENTQKVLRKCLLVCVDIILRKLWINVEKVLRKFWKNVEWALRKFEKALKENWETVIVLRGKIEEMSLSEWLSEWVKKWLLFKDLDKLNN